MAYCWDAPGTEPAGQRVRDTCDPLGYLPVVGRRSFIDSLQLCASLGHCHYLRSS